MKTVRGKLAFERLEERRMLAINIAGEEYLLPPFGEEFWYVAPAQTSFSPMALPYGITPPGATQLPPPPSGELPPGMTQFSGVAETNASVLAVGWLYTHEDALGDVSSGIGNNSAGILTYSATLEVHEGPDFFQYGVSETSAQIAMQYVVRDGAHSEILSSFEVSPGIISQSELSTLGGGLVYAQFDNNALTALAIHSEVAGAVDVWTCDGDCSGIGNNSPGLLPASAYGALDALVQAHLAGPGAPAALDSFHGALDAYYTLSGTGPVLADFNHDGQIDGADYVAWRKTGGTAGDYNLWRRHFGESVPASEAAAAGAGVPEPASIALAALAAGGAAVVSQRRRQPSAGTR